MNRITRFDSLAILGRVQRRYLQKGMGKDTLKVKKMGKFKVFSGCFQGVSRVLSGCFQGVSRVFSWCFRVFPGCFHGVFGVFVFSMLFAGIPFGPFQDSNRTARVKTSKAPNCRRFFTGRPHTYARSTNVFGEHQQDLNSTPLYPTPPTCHKRYGMADVLKGPKPPNN